MIEMGIAQAAKKFLAQLFGSKTISPKELAFSDLDEYLSKISEKETSALSEKAFSRFSEIRFLTAQLKAGFGNLSHHAIDSEKGNPSLRKVVASSQHSLAERLSSLISRLEPPRIVTFASVSHYCLTAYPLLQKEILSMRKDIAYTGILLKKEVKGLGENFSELEEVLSDLFEDFSKSPVTGVFPKVFSNRDAIRELEEKNRELKQQHQKIKSELLELENQITFQEQKNKTEKHSAAARRLEELRTQFAELSQQQITLEQNLSVLLEPVDKPLRRLHQIVEAKTDLNTGIVLRPELAFFLSTLNRSPVAAFKSDPKGTLFKEVLMELKQALDSGIVSLKEKEKQKCTNAIFSLAEYDFFEQFFWKHNKAEVEKQKIDRELKSSVYLMNLAAIQTEVARLKARAAQLTSEQSGTTQALEKNNSEIETRLKELEKLLGQTHGAQVTIHY